MSKFMILFMSTFMPISPVVLTISYTHIDMIYEAQRPLHVAHGGEAYAVRHKALHGKIVQGQEAVLVHAPSGGAASSKKGKAAFASEPTGSTGNTKKKTSEVEAALAMFKTVVAAKAAGGK